MYNLTIGCNFLSSGKITREAVVLDVSGRKWGFSYTRAILIDENDEKHRYRDSDMSFKDFPNIPKYVLPYFSGIHKDYDAESGNRNYFLEVNDGAKKLQIDPVEAYKFCSYVADKMPENVEDLSPDIVKRFVNVLNEKKGYDISVLFVMATKAKKASSYFGARFDPEKFVVIDRFMNPVDTKAFFEVMDKIIVKK